MTELHPTTRRRACAMHAAPRDSIVLYHDVDDGGSVQQLPRHACLGVGIGVGVGVGVGLGIRDSGRDRDRVRVGVRARVRVRVGV